MTMKKVFFIVVLLLFPNLFILAEDLLLVLNTRYIDPVDVVGTKPESVHRSPARKHTIIISNRNILLNGAFEGCRMCLVDGNEDVIFSYDIENGCEQITIPSSIFGAFELQIISGNTCYYCELVLD